MHVVIRLGYSKSVVVGLISTCTDSSNNNLLEYKPTTTNHNQMKLCILYIYRPDPVLQDLVYKLVPSLYDGKEIFCS